MSNQLTLGGTAGTILWEMDAATTATLPLGTIAPRLSIWKQLIPGVRPPSIFWKFDDAVGADKLDFMGVSDLEEVISSGTFSSVTGQVGLATQMVGSSIALQPVTTAKLTMPPGDFTVAFWFYPISPGLSDQYLFSYGANTLAGTVTIEIWPGTLTGVRFFTEIANLAVTANAPTMDTWNFVACWHNAATNTNYVQLNGGAIASVTGGEAATGPIVTRLGRHVVSGAQFNGALDAFGIYPWLLSTAELAILAAGREPSGYVPSAAEITDGTLTVLDSATSVIPATGSWTSPSGWTISLSNSICVQGSAFTSTLTVTDADGNLVDMTGGYADVRLNWDPEGSTTKLLERIVPDTTPSVIGTVTYKVYSGGFPYAFAIWPGVTVQLQTADTFTPTPGQIIDTAVTDANGRYVFSPLAAAYVGTTVYAVVIWPGSQPPTEPGVSEGGSRGGVVVIGPLTLDVVCTDSET